MQLEFKPKYKEIVENTELSRAEKLETILKDTLEYYNSNNRCQPISGAGCTYTPAQSGLSTSQSEGCAVGRLLTEQSAEYIDTLLSRGAIDDIIIDLENEPELGSLPDFIVDEETFFRRLQQLHDRPEYWTESGVNEESAKNTLDDIKLIINGSVK